MAVDVRERVPSEVRESPEVIQIANGANPEFDLMHERVDQATLNIFPQYCDEQGILVYEQWLELPVIRGDDLQVRRDRVIAKLNETLPYTWITLHKMMAKLVGWGNFTLGRDGAKLLYTITLPDLTPAMEENIQTLFENVIPMNLYWEFTHRPETDTEGVKTAGSCITEIGITVIKPDGVPFRRWTPVYLSAGTSSRNSAITRERWNRTNHFWKSSYIACGTRVIKRIVTAVDKGNRNATRDYLSCGTQLVTKVVSR